jgi:O-antigen ligase
MRDLLANMNSTLALRRPAVAALVLFGLLPYVSTIKWPPIASFWAEWACALLAAGVVILIRPRSTNADSIPVPLAALACLGGALVVALQLASRQPHFIGAALLAVCELVLAAVVCTAAARLRTTSAVAPALDAWALGLLIALVLNGAEVLVERNGWQVYIDTFVPRAAGARTSGLFGQPNQLAVFAVMAWCAGHYLWLRGKLPGALYLCTAAVVGLISAGAASRAGTLLLLGATGLAWLALRSHARRREGQRLLLGAVALFVLMELVWAVSTTSAGLATTVLRADTASRTEMLRHAFQLAAMHPLSGVGFGNFSAARWTELSGPLMHPNSGHAHNVVAHLAAELGVIGAAVLLLPLAWCVLRCARIAARRGVTPEQFFVAAVVLVLSGYSLFEYPLWYTFFLLPFVFSLGLVEQPGLTLSPVQTEPMNVLRVGTWLLTLSLGVMLALDYRRSESLYTVAVMGQLAESRDPTRLELPTKTVRDIALLTTFDNYADLMLSRTLVLNGRLMADKLPITERVMLAFPNWETVSRHITLLVAAGKEDEALRVWAKTERNPRLRQETYEALQRGIPAGRGLGEFVAALRRPDLVAPPLP